MGKKVAISVRLLNEHGKDAGWAPLVILTVVPPDRRRRQDRDCRQSQPAGVHLKWTSSAPKFRVFRHLLAGPGFEQVATPEKPEYDDAVDFGKGSTLALRAGGWRLAGDGTAESDNSATVIPFTPQDVSSRPRPPVGLQLHPWRQDHRASTWTRNTEPDMAGYQVYRAFENNGFERIQTTQESTSYSDRVIEPGKHYRYAVTAVDRAGNESKNVGADHGHRAIDGVLSFAV